MSDFAPFIVTFLQQDAQVGREFLESYEQNKCLRALGRKLRSVSITGPNGHPVYAQGQFDEDSELVEDENGERIADETRIRFKSWPARLPGESLDALCDLELHIGECIKLTLGRTCRNNHNLVHCISFHSFDNDLRGASMVIAGTDGGRSMGVKIVATILPVTREQYSLLPSQPTEVNLQEVLSPLYSNSEQVVIMLRSVVFQTSLSTGWNADNFHVPRPSTLLLSHCKQQRKQIRNDSSLSKVDLSELAQQVASELCERTILDLNEENQRLRALVREMRQVSITGPGGSPIYAQGHLDEDGHIHENLDECWTVEFPRHSPAPFASAEMLCGAEVHIGEVVRVGLTSHYNGNYNSHGNIAWWHEWDHTMTVEFEGEGGAIGLTLYVQP